MDDYTDLADLAEAGALAPLPGTTRRGAEATTAARHEVLAATGADTLEQATSLALGRPKLGTRPGAGPSPAWRVRASAELHAAATAAADRRDITVSELVRHAVAEYLKADKSPTAAESTHRSRSS